MKVKYVGKSFGIESLTDGKTYECIGIEDGMLRIIDDSDEDYLYSAERPGPLESKEDYGRWEIVEDDENGSLKKTLGN